MKKIMMAILALTGMAATAQSIKYYNGFPSQYVAERNVEVWLPKEYDENADRRFPVLYMHDGQNVFNKETSYGGKSWEVDSVAAAMIADGRIEPLIIVAVWNSPKRFEEYCPAKPIAEADVEVRDYLNNLRKDFQKDLKADEYLKFLVTELKPYIDKTYRTKSDSKNTSICGSSMGGLISMYAICEFPQVFSQAACVSTHWPLGYNNDNPQISGVLKNYVRKHLPSAEDHRIYFDHGTATLDSLYEVHQNEVDKAMIERGYVKGMNWDTQKFEGAEHNEPAWRARMDVILGFLYSKDYKAFMESRVGKCCDK